MSSDADANRGRSGPGVPMTPERWRATSEYMQQVFGAQDEQFATLMERATRAGLPDIAVTADVGRLLMLLCSMCGDDGRGAHTAVEVGTLAGYSGIWLARGLRPGGRLITIEADARHAAFAQREFESAGVAERVDLRVATGIEALRALHDELGPRSVDLLFLDAVKTEYEAYLDAALPLLRPGALLLADNTLGSSSWWITDAPGSSDNRDAIDRFNRRVASDPAFETSMIPIREGLLVARRTR